MCIHMHDRTVSRVRRAGPWRSLSPLSPGPAAGRPVHGDTTTTVQESGTQAHRPGRGHAPAPGAALHAAVLRSVWTVPCRPAVGRPAGRCKAPLRGRGPAAGAATEPQPAQPARGAAWGRRRRGLRRCWLSGTDCGGSGGRAAAVACACVQRSSGGGGRLSGASWCQQYLYIDIVYNSHRMLSYPNCRGKTLIEAAYMSVPAL